MRCDQPMGLPPAAKTFLQRYLVPPVICPTCGNYSCKQPEQIGSYSGFDEHPLHRHKLVYGHEAEEFHQITEWSSGPMMFLGLRIIGDDRIFTWSDEEIAACL